MPSVSVFWALFPGAISTNSSLPFRFCWVFGAVLCGSRHKFLPSGTVLGALFSGAIGTNALRSERCTRLRLPTLIKTSSCSGNALRSIHVRWAAVYQHLPGLGYPRYQINSDSFAAEDTAWFPTEHRWC